VYPAAEMPNYTVKNGGRLVIINLQKTPLDDIASMVIHGKIEDVMVSLMKKLEIAIPEWKIVRRISISSSIKGNSDVNGEKKFVILIQPIDELGNPYSFIKHLKIQPTNLSSFQNDSLSKEYFKEQFKYEINLHDFIDLNITL